MNAATPTKRREYPNRFFDSAAWNDLRYRQGDIVIASYAKAGTTLVQQIVAQLVFGGRAEVDVAALSPWLDSVHPDRATKLALLQAQAHRRFIKTHLPADALAFDPGAKYLYVGRDGRDIACSLYDHQRAVARDAQARLDAAGTAPGRLRVLAAPQASPTEYFQTWLERDGHPFWPFWEGVRSWWPLRGHDQVLFVHFARLRADLPGEIRRIADFLDIRIEPAAWPAILEHCSFGYMKAHAARYVPHGTGLWQDDGRAFFSAGRAGRWRDTLTPAAGAAYEWHARAELGKDCAHWLACGEPT
ncbi:MAG: sulfotransferase domain-containing protein [Pseudomonas sp.]